MAITKRVPTSSGISGFPILGFMAFVVALFLVFGVGAASCVQVDKGYVGVKTTWGRVDPDSLGPGLHFIMPVAQRVTHVKM